MKYAVLVAAVIGALFFVSGIRAETRYDIDVARACYKIAGLVYIIGLIVSAVGFWRAT